jgi:hypothetical protein
MTPRIADELGRHVRHCCAQRGRWFALGCAAEAAHAVIAPRFVTSLVAVFAVFGALALVF